VRPGSRRTAQAWLTELRKEDEAAARRIQFLSGDVTWEGIFAEPAARRRVEAEGTAILHLAAAGHLDVDAGSADAVNVGGTRRLLQVATSMKGLRRLVHVSDASVAGDFPGRFLESMLDEGQGFPNELGPSKLRAERLIREEFRELPIVVVRPSQVVGDSRTGETERGDGIYHLILLLLRIAELPRPLRLLPLVPGGRAAHVDLVPVDFVAGALLGLLDDGSPAVLGGTFHLADPRAPTVREFLAMLAPRLGLGGPWLQIPGQPLGRVLMNPRLAGPRRWMDAVLGLPPELHRGVVRRSLMDCSEAERVLGPRGLRAPPLESYVDQLLAYAREKMR
jgi:nucleoside-diphosphate-sugar epimerase